MASLSDQYDDIVRRFPKETHDAILFYKDALARRGCKFGNDVIPTFLKAEFLTEDQVQEFDDSLTHAASILDKVTRLYFSHPEFREYFHLKKPAADLIEIDHGYSRNVVISRPDAFLVDGSLRFVEFNCDSPAGAGYSDIEEEIFLETFPFQRFGQKYQFQRKERCQILLDALLSAYKEFAGQNKKPNIAIMDWREVRTQNEFRLIQAFFKNKGYETIIADPRDLKFINGRLEHNGFPIDLIYRRAIFRELVEKINEVQDFLTAYKNGKVCVVNPLRSRLASSKVILSILTNQREFRQLFTEEENHFINKHVPWTRRVDDIKTHYEDNEVFLKKHILAHKDTLVMKPSDSYGGKDVHIGPETDQKTWEALVAKIIKNAEHWVVQKYVEITSMTVPVIENGTAKIVEKKCNLNPFVFYGRYAGCMARLSDQSVINVSAGGGLIPGMGCKERK